MPSISPKNSEKGPLHQHGWLDLLAQVVATGRQIQREIDRQTRCEGLSDSQFLLLWLTAQSPEQGSCQNELAAQLGLSAAQISGLVEQLRRQNLLESRRAQNDRRRQLWRITEAGEQMLRRIADQWELPARSPSETMTPPVHDALQKGLAQIGQAATDSDTKSGPTLRVVPQQGVSS